MPAISGARRNQLSHTNPDADRYQIRCLWCTWTDIASRYTLASAAANGHITRAHPTHPQRTRGWS